MLVFWRTDNLKLPRYSWFVDIFIAQSNRPFRVWRIASFGNHCWAAVSQFLTLGDQHGRQQVCAEWINLDKSQCWLEASCCQSLTRFPVFHAIQVTAVSVEFSFMILVIFLLLLRRARAHAHTRFKWFNYVGQNLFGFNVSCEFLYTSSKLMLLIAKC